MAVGKYVKVKGKWVWAEESDNDIRHSNRAHTMFDNNKMQIQKVNHEAQEKRCNTNDNTLKKKTQRHDVKAPHSTMFAIQLTEAKRKRYSRPKKILNSWQKEDELRLKAVEKDGLLTGIILLSAMVAFGAIYMLMAAVWPSIEPQALGNKVICVLLRYVTDIITDGHYCLAQ
jgi:hypothetical protein